MIILQVKYSTPGGWGEIPAMQKFIFSYYEKCHSTHEVQCNLLQQEFNIFPSTSVTEKMNYDTIKANQKLNSPTVYQHQHELRKL